MTCARVWRTPLLVDPLNYASPLATIGTPDGRSRPSRALPRRWGTPSPSTVPRSTLNSRRGRNGAQSAPSRRSLTRYRVTSVRIRIAYTRGSSAFGSTLALPGGPRGVSDRLFALFFKKNKNISSLWTADVCRISLLHASRYSSPPHERGRRPSMGTLWRALAVGASRPGRWIRRRTNTRAWASSQTTVARHRSRGRRCCWRARSLAANGAATRLRGRCQRCPTG
jgi:hypothetical protein